MIFASKNTSSLNNLKILSPKVTKNLTNVHKKFVHSHPVLEQSGENLQYFMEMLQLY
jgi:hypothetical protein